MAHRFQVTFDANDPALLAEFWTQALGYIVQPPPPDFDSWDDWARSMDIPEERWNDARALIDPDGNLPRVFIQRVPEGKTAKNRVHLDVAVSVGSPPDERQAVVDAEATRLESLGAVRLGPHEQFGSYWIVMQDPEGNEFCVT